MYKSLCALQIQAWSFVDVLGLVWRDAAMEFISIYANLRLIYLLRLPLIEVGKVLRAYCYSTASYP